MWAPYWDLIVEMMPISDGMGRLSEGKADEVADGNCSFGGA